MSVILLPQRWRDQPQGNVKLRPDWAGIVAAYVCGDRYFDGKDEGRIQPTTQQIIRPSVRGLAVGTIADSTPIALPIVNGPTFTDWGFVFVGRKVTHTSTDGAAGFANSSGAYLEISTGSVSSDLRPVATGLTNHFSVSSLSGTPVSGALVGSYSTSLSTGFVYRDGDLVATGSHTYTNNAPVLYLALGGRYLATNRNWRGNSELIAVLGQKQGQEIARDLSIDPWQMFAVDPVRVYFDLGAGGTFDAIPSGATAQSVTSTGATPKCTITRTGSSPAGTLYYVIYPDGGGVPSAAQIIAGQDSTGSAATASGSEACRTTSGDQVFATPAAGCAASTAYRIAFVASDGVTPSAVAVSASAFTTLADSVVTTVTPASLTIAGQTVGEFYSQSTIVAPAAVVIAGQTLNSIASLSTQVAPASVAITGQTVGSRYSQSTLVTPAALTIAGQVVNSNFSASNVITVDPAAVTITPQNVNSRVTFSTVVTPASLALTPQNITSVWRQSTVVSPASILITGQTVNSSAARDYVTQVSPASVSITPQNIGSSWSGSVALPMAVAATPSYTNLQATPTYARLRVIASYV